jgi:hypothetical protein
MVQPFSASLFDRWRNGVKWPTANQGNIKMRKLDLLEMRSLIFAVDNASCFLMDEVNSSPLYISFCHILNHVHIIWNSWDYP